VTQWGPATGHPVSRDDESVWPADLGLTDAATPRRPGLAVGLAPLPSPFGVCAMRVILLAGACWRLR
jgi:hypothetical protein